MAQFVGVDIRPRRRIVGRITLHAVRDGIRRIVGAAEVWIDRAEIPVTVVDLEEIVRGEFAENAQREDFLPTEIEAIRRAMAPVEHAAAKGRQGTRTDLDPTSAKISHKSPARTADKIGAFAGVSGRTVEKIAAVVQAAEREPEKFGHLPAEMDKSGSVNSAYRKLRMAEDEHRGRHSM